jgi:hypothetical protein
MLKMTDKDAVNSVLIALRIAQMTENELNISHAPSSVKPFLISHSSVSQVTKNVLNGGIANCPI